MNLDYLLVCMDPKKRFSMRFVSLKHSLAEIMSQKKPSLSLGAFMAQAILGSTLLSTRKEGQESTLFKFCLTDPQVRFNCEVSPVAGLRCAVFPAELRQQEIPFDLDGQLTVAVLKQNQEIYESVIEFEGAGVLGIFEEYLLMSTQKDSFLCLHHDLDTFENNYGLWIERLPGTSVEAWDECRNQFGNGQRFSNCFAHTNDPDKMMEALFGPHFKILSVLTPKLTCSCSKDRFLRAMKVLPKEELMEVFVANQGLTSQCEYCQKVWEATDEDVQRLLGVPKNIKH